jgi:hypothetical protein
MTVTPTADLQNMIGPGQEGVVDQFIEDLQQQYAAIAEAEAQQQGQESEEQPLLAGKFKSTEDLEKAYLEAQKLISQRGQQPTVKDSLPVEDQPRFSPDQYTPDLGKQLYGDTVATAIELAEINPLEMAQKAEAGDDVSSYVDALVEKGGLPRQLVETYLQGVAPAKGNVPAQPDGSTGSLTEDDVSELKAMVGGDEQFQQLSQWAMANLDQQELADYNAAVDSGKAAARFALKQLQVRASLGSSAEPKEPKLIGGGTAVKTDVFETQQQAIEAMRKTNPQGKRLYNTDPKYRSWYEKTLARSNFAA